MHTDAMQRWQHDHVFGQNLKRPGEARTVFVVCLTATMMAVEISAGVWYGSMALLADGLHMASHAAALSVSVFAYVISRRLAADPRFAFGVGKINSLAGFASAVMLIGFAVAMATESAGRMIEPVPIVFDSALVVAVVGLLVNGASARILSASPARQAESSHHFHDHDHHDHHHDHNLRAAYLHVLADALTSVLAIFALLAGKYLGAVWLDPAMGIAGALLVARWSYGLIRDTARVLLDHQADRGVVERVRAAVEADTSDRVADLHVWSIGPGILAADISVVTHAPKPPAHYRALLPRAIVHATVEVNECPGSGSPRAEPGRVSEADRGPT